MFFGLIQKYFRMAGRRQNKVSKVKTSKQLTMVASPQRVLVGPEALSPVSGSIRSISFFPACAVETRDHCFCHGNCGLRHGTCSYAKEFFLVHISGL